MLDFVIKGGRVIDGTGNPWFRADVGICGDTIAAVGNLGAVPAARTIDARGLMVAPGFVDVHSHSDYTLLACPTADSALLQGVTTQVVGNCGITYAPVSELNRESVVKMSRTYQPDVEVDWQTFGEYMARLERSGQGTNIACLVGHGALRRAVMGLENRKATPEELGQMKELLTEALKAGAAGLSTGLEFVPGRYADLDELMPLVQVVADHGGVYATHMRNRDARFEEATAEGLATGERTGVSLQLSHVNAKPGSAEGAWQRVVAMMEGARERGLDVTSDTVPYTTGPGLIAAILPDWVFEGGINSTLARLRDPAIRARLKKECNRYWMMIAYGQWDRITLAHSEKNSELVGLTLEEISRLKGKDPYDCLFDILVAEGEGMDHAVMNGRLFTEEQVRELEVHPLFMLASDGWTSTISGPLAQVSHHPSCYSWTATLLGEHVRDRKWLRLEEAVRKMTSFPAQKFGLRNRGLLREGMAADVVLFDAAHIKANGTYERPHQYPSGVEYVLINGQLAVEKGQLKGVVAGRVLRGPGTS